MVLTVSAPALAFWTWVLIYGGLPPLSLGLLLLRTAPDLGWTPALTGVLTGMLTGVLTGAALATAGVVLVFVRARLPETPSQNMPRRKE